jgi:hypothetical protein
MKDTPGGLVREAWKQKEAPDCQHLELTRAYSFSHSFTGSYLWTTFGQLMEIKSAQMLPRLTQPVKYSKPSGRLH